MCDDAWWGVMMHGGGSVMMHGGCGCDDHAYTLLLYAYVGFVKEKKKRKKKARAHTIPRLSGLKKLARGLARRSCSTIWLQAVWHPVSSKE